MRNTRLAPHREAADRFKPARQRGGGRFAKNQSTTSDEVSSS
jgi:hypothetical protein